MISRDSHHGLSMLSGYTLYNRMQQYNLGNRHAWGCHSDSINKKLNRCDSHHERFNATTTRPPD
jgi:hypothetical protein